MNITRSDRLGLKADRAEQREALQATLAIYRALVRELMSVIATHRPMLGPCSDNKIIGPVEALVHGTAKRPVVRYTYFAQRYYKFPSYLRRAAIMDAAVDVRHRHVSEPVSGQCVQFDADRHQCRIKVRHRGDWVWMTLKPPTTHSKN